VRDVVVVAVVVEAVVVVSDMAQQQGKVEMPFSLFSRAKVEVVAAVVVIAAADVVVVIELSQYFCLQAVALEPS